MSLSRKVRSGRHDEVLADWRQLLALTDAFKVRALVWRGLVQWDKTE